MQTLLDRSRVILIALIVFALLGAGWIIASRAWTLILSGVIAWVLGALFAAVLLGCASLLAKPTRQLSVLVVATPLFIFALLTALAFAFEDTTSPAAVESTLLGYELALGAALVSFLFWRVAARRRAGITSVAGDDPAMSAQPARDVAMWKRAAFGVAAATAFSYAIAALPAAWEYYSVSSADRAFFAYGVMFMVAAVVPTAALLAFSFAPAFLLFERVAWRGRLPYVLWGALVLPPISLLIASYFGIATTADSRYVMIVLAFFLGGAAGLAFWFGAHAPVLYRALERRRARAAGPS